MTQFYMPHHLPQQHQLNIRSLSDEDIGGGPTSIPEEQVWSLLESGIPVSTGYIRYLDMVAASPFGRWHDNVSDRY